MKLCGDLLKFIEPFLNAKTKTKVINLSKCIRNVCLNSYCPKIMNDYIDYDDYVLMPYLLKQYVRKIKNVMDHSDLPTQLISVKIADNYYGIFNLHHNKNLIHFQFNRCHCGYISGSQLPTSLKYICVFQLSYYDNIFTLTDILPKSINNVKIYVIDDKFIPENNFIFTPPYFSQTFPQGYPLYLLNEYVVTMY